MLLYNHLKHKGKKANSMLARYPIVALTRLNATAACRMIAQILHVKKAARVTVYTRGSDKSKKMSKSYDRLLFLRDLVSGEPFVIISESKQDSVVLFHGEVKIGDYVTLYLPEHSKHTVADTNVVRYRDVLFPLKKPPRNKLVASVPQGAKFSTFATNIDPKEFQMIAIGIETVCSGQMCDGAVESPCPCLGGTTVAKQAVSFKIKVPVIGLEENHVRYRSIAFTKYFFGPTVMKNLHLYDTAQVEQVMVEAIQHVDNIIVAGWVGYFADNDDDIGIATTTHVTSIRLTFKQNEGQPAFTPKDDLPLPPENIEEEDKDNEDETDNDEDVQDEEESHEENSHLEQSNDS